MNESYLSLEILKREGNMCQHFLNPLQLPGMGSGHNGVHVQKHVVILVWREQEPVSAFVKFVNWDAMASSWK